MNSRKISRACKQLICISAFSIYILFTISFCSSQDLSNEPSETNVGAQNEFNETWTYMGSAAVNISDGIVVLTKNQSSQTGVIWFWNSVVSPFEANFRYKAGGGTAGDGFVFMFYKGGVWPVSGYLGFKGPGYGIEFDSHPDSFDPKGKHIAIIKDGVTNHLAYKLDDRVADNRWHNAKVIVNESNINAYIDDALVLEWSDNIDNAYHRIGFSASTSSLNNWHLIDIDDFRISELKSTQNVSQLMTIYEDVGEVSSNKKMVESLKDSDSNDIFLQSIDADGMDDTAGKKSGKNDTSSKKDGKP